MTSPFFKLARVIRASRPTSSVLSQGKPLTVSLGQIAPRLRQERLRKADDDLLTRRRRSVEQQRGRHNLPEIHRNAKGIEGNGYMVSEEDTFSELTGQRHAAHGN